MKLDQFLSEVSERAGIDRDEADKAARATLSTLAERLAGGEADDLASQLPGELGDTMRLTERAGAGRSLSLDEFLAVVAGREGVEPEEARDHARAVFSTVRDSVTGGEFDDVVSQLPAEFRELVAA